MPGHYNYPTPPAPPKVSPLKPKNPFDEQNTNDAAGKSTKINPFKGQFVIRNGKKVPRTPSTKPHKD